MNVFIDFIAGWRKGLAAPSTPPSPLANRCIGVNGHEIQEPFSEGNVVVGDSLIGVGILSRTLLHIVADDLGCALEGDETVPFGPAFPVAMAVLLPVSSGERKAGDSHATCRGTDFGILTDVPE
jgi:hypothetical protein